LFLKAKDTLKLEVKKNLQWVIRGIEVCLEALLLFFNLKNQLKILWMQIMRSDTCTPLLGQ